jgi:hypothetical protein
MSAVCPPDSSGSATSFPGWGRGSSFGLPDNRPEPTPRRPDEKPNWDALIDYFRDVAVPERCALFWRAADEFAARHPRIFAEACVVLAGILDGDLARRGSQVVLLLSGAGPDFRQPPGLPG